MRITGGTKEHERDKTRSLLLLLLVDGGSAGSLLLLDALAEHGGVGLGLGAGLLGLGLLESLALALALEHDRGDQALDLGRLVLRLLALLVDLATDHKLGDVVILGQVEQLADVRGALGSQATRAGHVGDTRELTRALVERKKGGNRGGERNEK